ncbi:hypothetical protein [Streptomyces sp. PU-14G]|uniref:hypothetical protein n=1 Tax=Streptomyces sp. PU-14G TaxID=2800808 RepID=UPI0034DE1392
MTRPRIRTAPDRALWRAARLAALTDAPDAFTRGLADWYRGGEEEWMARLADRLPQPPARGAPSRESACRGPRAQQDPNERP